MQRPPNQKGMGYQYPDRYGYYFNNGSAEPGNNVGAPNPQQMNPMAYAQPAAQGAYPRYVPPGYPYQMPQMHQQQMPGPMPGAQPMGRPVRAPYPPYGQPAAMPHYGQPAAATAANQYMGYLPAQQMTVEDRIVQALQRDFPNVQQTTLRTAARVHHTYDAASEWIRAMQRQGMMTAGPVNTAKREVQRPAMSIREKFAQRGMMSGMMPGQSMAMRPTQYTPGPYDFQAASARKKLSRRKYQDEDDMSDSGGSDGDEAYNQQSQYEFELRVLRFLNSATQDAIIDVCGCTEDMAKAVIKKRPYASLAAIQKVDVPAPAPEPSDQKRRRGATKKSAGSKIVDASLSTLRGYEAVDSLIQECAKVGKDVQAGINAWGVDLKSDGELEVTEVDDARGGFFKEKPKLLSPDVELKNYQQVGVNWLNLLYNRKLSCILADEMGLGKTCQVISFLAHLKEVGEPGPHLVVCPSSTLENWLREFNRFCPGLVVETYYGSQNERMEIRENIIATNAEFDVMVTTYNLATGGKQDMGFLKSMRFNVCIYDEGHLLKNSQSERYNKLMKLRARFRVLLTGTPLQNNLRELISLLSFILPSLFEENKEDLLEVFKFKAKTSQSPQDADSRSQLLSEQRIVKAKTMMTPFVLRRRKEQVLRHLPPKTHEIIYCDMTETQAEVYRTELSRNRKSIQEHNDEVKAEEDKKGAKKSKQASIALDNVLMQLRKAALHPLLFRRMYTDKKLKRMARDIMQEEQYKSANQEYIFEDMQVMNDFELNRLCQNFPITLGKDTFPSETYFDSGKVQQLRELVVEMQKNGDRVLVFSQFTQVLDILEKIMNHLNISFLRLDGQTPVEMRQDIIDKFHDEEDITVFLLSTKAGGFGINLACANVVIIFDLSFNPHDDKQAEDRAHRVGQTRSVRVIRLITKNSIEENILALANTKLALDRHVSEENDELDPESEALVADMVLQSSAANLSTQSAKKKAKEEFVGDDDDEEEEDEEEEEEEDDDDDDDEDADENADENGGEQVKTRPIPKKKKIASTKTKAKSSGSPKPEAEDEAGNEVASAAAPNGHGAADSLLVKLSYKKASA